MIEHFIGKYYFLSNAAITDIEIDDLLFKSAESALYSYMDLDRQLEFLKLNAVEARKLSEEIEPREDWDEERDHILYRILRAKFEQNEGMYKKLLETEGKELVFNNIAGDTYLGVYKGEGKNLLGRTLTLIRDYFIQEEKLKKIISEQAYDPIYEKYLELLTQSDAGE